MDCQQCFDLTMSFSLSLSLSHDSVYDGNQKQYSISGTLHNIWDLEKLKALGLVLLLADNELTHAGRSLSHARGK